MFRTTLHVTGCYHYRYMYTNIIMSGDLKLDVYYFLLLMYSSITWRMIILCSSLSLSFTCTLSLSLLIPLSLSLPLLHYSSIGNGSWVIAGVTTTDVTTSGNQTAIQCTSTHLTSFAVLVDVAGGLAVSTWGITAH